MGFVLQYIQRQQKNLEHFSDESDVIGIVEIGEGLCAQRYGQQSRRQRGIRRIGDPQCMVGRVFVVLATED